MPAGGVSTQFVGILRADRNAAGRRGAILASVTLLLAVPAYYILPWQGLLAHGVAAVAGAILGNLWSRRTARRFEASLRSKWKSWMRWSLASESVSEVAQRVEGRSTRNVPGWTAALLTALWALELGLLVLAFSDTESAAFAFPVLILNGLVPAALAAHHLHRRGWVRELDESLADLVQTGELGVWGVI